MTGLWLGNPESDSKVNLILKQQKLKLPFYLYACCLMPNQVHLLIEMQDDAICRITPRVLTSLVIRPKF